MVAATSSPLTLTVSPGPTISTGSSLPQGEVGQSYATTLSASGGTGIGYTWSLANGSSLPGGLSLSSGGVISGTPTASGPFSFTVQVTDSAGGSGTQAFSLSIATGPTITNAPTLPNGTQGVTYSSVTLTATGGTSPYTWSITAGALPAGLTLNGNSGIISGTPTATGTFNPTVQVQDAKGVTSTKQFSITIASGLTIVTAPTLPSGNIGTPYSVTLMAQGGTGSYTWGVTAGALPNGLTLGAAGVLSGSPTSSGSFSFSVQVTDSNNVTATKVFTLSITSRLAISTPTTLPIGSVGVPYSLTLEATGGTGNYQWKIASGSLPAGMVFATTGAISGTPAGSGTFSFTVNVTDTSGLAASQQFSLTIASGLAISTPAQLPSGSVGAAYSQTLTAVGGTLPYRWSLTAGTLPPGLGLNAVTGALFGTPTANGVSRFTVQVTDNAGAIASQIFNLTIGSSLTITTQPALPNATVGASYSAALTAVGGAAPYTWSITQGSLPAGLSLTGATISGTPSAAGSYTFTAQVTDSNRATFSQAFTLSINPSSLPQVNIAGVPESSAAGQQITFSVALTTPYQLDITGTIAISFAPDAVASAVDPAIQFSTGGTTVSFTIPKGTTNAVFGSSNASQIGLQTGTVAGAITLDFTFEAGSVQLTTFNRTITIPRTAPTITAVTVVTNANTFQVEVTGFSTPRELTEADLTFTQAAGASLQTTSAIIDLTAVGKQWFQSAGSAQFGSQYILVLPFTASQGSISAVASVTVTLKDSEGSSSSASANF